jgi:hypothetical protein
MSMRHLPLLFLLTSCAPAAPTRPPTFNDLMLGEQVPAAVVDQAAALVAECLGTSMTIDGWTVWIVADSYAAIEGEAFRCPTSSPATCGPPPEGYTEATAPCECAGLTNRLSKRIALTPNRSALRHELLHAYGLEHADADFARCLR